MPYVNWRGENVPGGVFFSHSFLGNLDGTPVLRIVTETPSLAYTFRTREAWAESTC